MVVGNELNNKIVEYFFDFCNFLIDKTNDKHYNTPIVQFYMRGKNASL